MPYSSLWDRARGKTPFDDMGDWPKRCNSCGRRLEFDDYVSILVSVVDTKVLIHDVCSQHGGKHTDCLKGIEVDFGDGESWPAIWMSNLSHELTLWVKSTVRFVWLVSTHSLRIVTHPVRYRRCRQKMREWGIDE